MQRLTCSHNAPLAEPCGLCSNDMSTDTRIDITAQRMVELENRKIPTGYARAEYDALLLRKRAEVFA